MKIICIGKNYKKHIEELFNGEKNSEPVVFLKPDSAIIAKNQAFFIPNWAGEIHHEIEIIVKIDKVGRYIQSEFAHTYYSQIGIGIDFTDRKLQWELKEQGLPWEKAKSFDNSAFIGEFYDKNDFDLNNTTFSLNKNNEQVQIGNTGDMMLKIDEIICYVSKYFTLKMGDVIFTGTPHGVGKIEENDILEGFLNNKKVFSLNVK